MDIASYRSGPKDDDDNDDVLNSNEGRGGPLASKSNVFVHPKKSKGKRPIKSCQLNSPFSNLEGKKLLTVLCVLFFLSIAL